MPSLHFATASVGSVSLTFAVFVAGVDFAAGAADFDAPAGGIVAGAPFVVGTDLLAAELVGAADPAVTAGAVALFAALVADVAPFFDAAAVAFVSTPPWPEHAPLPDDAEVVPSLQMLLLACALRRPLAMLRAMAARAAESKRVCMGAPKEGFAITDPGSTQTDTLILRLAIRDRGGLTNRPIAGRRSTLLPCCHR